jgi:hypothetical protein
MEPSWYVIRVADRKWVGEDGVVQSDPSKCAPFLTFDDANAVFSTMEDPQNYYWSIQDNIAAHDVYCPDCHKMFCFCMKEAKREANERKEQRAKKCYAELGLELEWNGAVAKVLNHPGMQVSIYGKWKIGDKWDSGLGKLRERMKPKSKKTGSRKRSSKKEMKRPGEFKTIAIANMYGDVDVKNGFSSRYVHLDDSSLADVCLENKIAYGRALVGWEKVKDKWVPEHQGIVIHVNSIEKLQEVIGSTLPCAGQIASNG